MKGQLYNPWVLSCILGNVPVLHENPYHKARSPVCTCSVPLAQGLLYYDFWSATTSSWNTAQCYDIALVLLVQMNPMRQQEGYRNGHGDQQPMTGAGHGQLLCSKRTKSPHPAFKGEKKREKGEKKKAADDTKGKDVSAALRQVFKSPRYGHLISISSWLA